MMAAAEADYGLYQTPCQTHRAERADIARSSDARAKPNRPYLQAFLDSIADATDEPRPTHNPKVAGSNPAPAIPADKAQDLQKPCTPADRDLKGHRKVAFVVSLLIQARVPNGMHVQDDRARDGRRPRRRRAGCGSAVLALVRSLQAA